LLYNSIKTVNWVSTMFLSMNLCTVANPCFKIDIDDTDIPFGKFENEGVALRIFSSVFDHLKSVAVQIDILPVHDSHHPLLRWIGELPANIFGKPIVVNLKKETASVQAYNGVTYDLSGERINTDDQDALYRIEIHLAIPADNTVVADTSVERFILFKYYNSDYLNMLETKHLNPESIAYNDSKNFNLLGNKRGRDVIQFVNRKTTVSGKKLLDLGCATGGGQLPITKPGRM
jgi:hypothetical protein